MSRKDPINILLVDDQPAVDAIEFHDADRALHPHVGDMQKISSGFEIAAA